MRLHILLLRFSTSHPQSSFLIHPPLLPTQPPHPLPTLWRGLDALRPDSVWRSHGHQRNTTGTGKGIFFLSFVAMTNDHVVIGTATFIPTKVTSSSFKAWIRTFCVRDPIRTPHEFNLLGCALRIRLFFSIHSSEKIVILQQWYKLAIDKSVCNQSTEVHHWSND